MSLQFWVFLFVSPSETAAAGLTDPHCNLFFLTFNPGQTTRVHCVLSFFLFLQIWVITRELVV